MHRILLAMMSVLLIGCAGGGTQITDFSKRSVVYTYIDVSDIPGNKLQFFQMRNLSAPGNERYYPMGWEKLGNGYVVFHAGFAPGSYEFERLQTMSCAGPLCTNTINEFNFGPPGHGIGATRVGTPGVVFAGCYALKRTKRGFFRPGEFATAKTGCRVSQRQMLSVILARLREVSDPIPAQRVAAAMR